MSDSVPSLPSPKIRFRDLDVEFLQRQARIWLEVIVGERYDQSISLPSLLADGGILRKVSSRILELIQKNGDKESPSTSMPFPETSANGKHSGRYLPYSNIDTFLKVCQKVGLTGVDLFSPPDVVEEKDIRRVCLCIRALSQKARARNLKVPNFDSVTHNEAVPVGLVAGFKAFTQHLSAEHIESKETPDQKGANGRSAFMLQKMRRTDQKGSSNGSPYMINVSSSVDQSPNLIREKAETDTSSNLVNTVDAKCAHRPAVNGVKPLKRTISPPSSSSEEGAKSTNDFKATDSDITAFYEGFIKHKSNRSAPTLAAGDNKSSKLIIPKQQLHTEAQYALQSVNGYASSSTSSDGIESSEELSCTMDSYNVDTDASQDDTINANDEDGIHEQDLLPRDSYDKKDGVQEIKVSRRKIWRPVLSMTMALLGAVFIMQSRDPRIFRRIKNIVSQTSKKCTEKRVEDVAPKEGDDSHAL